MSSLAAVTYELDQQGTADHPEYSVRVRVRIPLTLPTRRVSRGYVRFITVARLADPVSKLLIVGLCLWVGFQQADMVAAGVQCTC